MEKLKSSTVVFLHHKSVQELFKTQQYLINKSKFINKLSNGIKTKKYLSLKKGVFTQKITTLWYCLVQKTVFYLFNISNVSLLTITQTYQARF